jgi:hypothetical protein
MERVEEQNDTNESEIKLSRRSRSADNRGMNDRTAGERPPIVFGNNSRFNLDESVRVKARNEGKEVAFVPYSIRGQESYETCDNACEKGWEYTEASKYSSLKRNYNQDPFRRRESTDEFVKVGGQILMERSLELKEAEDRYFNEENFHRQTLVEQHKWQAGGNQVFSSSRTKDSRLKI